MRYLSGRLFHQNKFQVKSIGPNLFFAWLLVLYYLTDAFDLVLFHVIYITSTFSMQKHSFANVFQNRCFQWNLWDLWNFFYRISPVVASIYVAFHECFLFYFSLTLLPLFPYRTVTFFIWWNTFVFISLLLHHYYHNSRMIHQDCLQLLQPTVLPFPW